MRKQKSFTLVELMVVIAIIIILAAIAIPTYLHLTNKAKVASIKSNIGVLATVLETYRTDLGAYPSTADATGLARWVAIDDKNDIFYQEMLGGASAKLNTNKRLAAQTLKVFTALIKTDIYTKPLTTRVTYTRVSSLGNTTQKYISGVTLNNITDPFKASEYIPNDGHIYYKSTDGTNWYLMAYTGLAPDYLWRSNASSEVTGGTLAQVPQLEAGAGALAVTLSGPTNDKIATEQPYTAKVTGGQPPYISYTFEGGGTPATQTGASASFTTQWAAPANPVIKVTVKDSFGGETIETLGVAMAGVPTVIINGPEDGRLATACSYTPTITGGSTPYTYAWSGGETPATGAVSGFTTQWTTTGTKTVTLRITDALEQTVSATLATLIPDTLIASASGPGAGKLATAYTYSPTVSGGKPPYTYAWEGGETPLMGAERTFTTQWTEAGAKTINLTVTDALNQTVTASAASTIASLVTGSVSGPTSGLLSTSYSYTANFFGGKAPFTYLWSNGGTDISADYSWGAPGTYAPDVIVTDDLGQTGTANINVTIQSTLAVTITPVAKGTVTLSPPGGTYDADTVVTLTENPAEGYAFASWGGAGSGTTATTTVTMDGNKTVMANFVLNTFTLTYAAGANGTISGTTLQTVICENNGTQVIAVPSLGYHFVVWSDAVATAARTDTNITADKAVTATFAINTFTLTASTGSNGTVTPTGVTTKDYGATQVYTITPATEYYILAVTVDGSAVGASSPYTFTAIAANHTVSATFAINSYTVTFKNWDGTVLSTPSVNYGGTVTAPGNPTRTGYTFAAWDRGLTNITAATTITATYNINQYTVIFNNKGGAQLSTQSVNYGGTAIAPGNPTYTGWTFTGWDRGLTNITAATTITATYNINTFTITASAGSYGSISATQIVNYGGSATFYMTPNSGYSLYYTNVDGVSQGGIASYTFSNVTANHTIETHFSWYGVVGQTWHAPYAYVVSTGTSTATSTVSKGGIGTFYNNVGQGIYGYPLYYSTSAASGVTLSGTQYVSSYSAAASFWASVRYGNKIDGYDYQTQYYYPSGSVSLSGATVYWGATMNAAGFTSMFVTGVTASNSSMSVVFTTTISDTAAGYYSNNYGWLYY